MADPVEQPQECRTAGRPVERAVLMQGTSRYREKLAELLARLLERTGAGGVAFGWTDPLAPDLVSPVHFVTTGRWPVLPLGTTGPGVGWTLDSPRTHWEAIDRDAPLEWKLVLTDVEPDQVARCRSTIEYLKGYLADATTRDVPAAVVGETADTGPFLELLDAFRFCGFRLARNSAATIRQAFREALGSLEPSVHEEAEEVVSALRDPPRLQTALLRLGARMDAGGDFVGALTVHLTGYELALHRRDGTAGIDTARSAARVYRRMGDLGSSVRWYRLAKRIAAFESQWGRLALALDGLGNTYRHRGSYPKARASYEEAWRYAVMSEDGTAIGNVAQSMMIAEREAGRLESAASYGWTALRHKADSASRASVLLNLGTLLREGGDLVSAERAFRVAYQGADAPDLEALSADALAYCAALKGETGEYERWRYLTRREARTREPFIRVQLGYFRALSLAALGKAAQASRVLRAVERYARRWNLAEWQVKASETSIPLPQRSPMDTPAEVRQGLEQLDVAAL